MKNKIIILVILLTSVLFVNLLFLLNQYDFIGEQPIIHMDLWRTNYLSYNKSTVNYKVLFIIYMVLLLILIYQEKLENKKYILLVILLNVFFIMMITNISKIYFKVPRPDIIQRCGLKHPNELSYLDCPNYNYIVVNNKYKKPQSYNEFIQLKKNKRMIEDGFKSFWSGHTSFAFSMTISILFIYILTKSRLSFYSFLFSLMFAFFVAFSRIYDNKHHKIDVIIGFIISVFISVIWYNKMLL